MVKKVGFIGLGDIGLPMAMNVIKRGFETIVVGHRRREPVEEMKKLGAAEAKTPKELAQTSDAVIIMVPDDKVASSVVFGADGLLEGAKKGFGILLMGTYSPAFCQRVGQACTPRGVDVLDAPVVGARMGAEAGKLGISVGGDQNALEKYRAVLETMGKITYCGELGMGEVVKLVNNMAAVINALVAYEAVAWGIKNGASEELLVEHMKAGSANSFMVQNWEWLKSYFVDPPPPTYYMGAKDLSYALAIGHETGQSSPIAALCCELFKKGPPKLR